VSIIAFFGGIGFWLCFRKLDKEEESLNLLPESTYIGKQEESVGKDEEDVPHQAKESVS
jgi:POT family proton-dependent oligopeptide transporter